MTDDVSAGRKRWLKIFALILCAVAMGVWLGTAFVAKCDLNMIERAAERVRGALEQRHGRPNIHAFEGLSEACSPHFPGVIQRDHTWIAGPDTSYGLMASVNPIELWRRQGAVAEACGIWRWEVEDLYRLATGETLADRAARIYEVCELARLGLSEEVALRGAVSWIWLVAADFMHEEGLLERPEGRLLLRALVSGSPPVLVPKGMTLYEAESTRAKTVVNAPQIAATRRAVIFEGHEVVDIRSGTIDKAHKAMFEGQAIVQPIFDHAIEEFLRQDRKSSAYKKNYEGDLNVIVDQTLPTEIAVDIGNSVQQARMNGLLWTVRSPTLPNDVLSFHFKAMAFSTATSAPARPLLFHLTERGLLIEKGGEAVAFRTPCPHAPEATVCHVLEPAAFLAQVAELSALLDKGDGADLEAAERGLGKLLAGLDRKALSQVFEGLRDKGGALDVSLRVGRKIPFALTARIVEGISAVEGDFRVTLSLLP